MFNYNVSKNEIETLKEHLKIEEMVIYSTMRLCEVIIKENNYEYLPTFNKEAYDTAATILDKASPEKEIYFEQNTDKFKKYKMMSMDTKYKEIDAIFQTRKRYINTAICYLNKHPSMDVHFYNIMDKLGYKYLSKILNGECMFY